MHISSHTISNTSVSKIFYKDGGIVNDLKSDFVRQQSFLKEEEGNNPS